MKMRLATTLFVDIVAFSQGSVEWQSRALGDIGAKLRQCNAFVTAESSGAAMVIAGGDGLAAAFFENPSDCLECARQLREAIRGADYRLRMAINLGELGIVPNDVTGRPSLSGSSVNHAARALTFAKPGEIVLTGAARDTFAQESPLSFRYIGDGVAKWDLELRLYVLVDDAAPPPPAGWAGLAARLVQRALEEGEGDLAAPALVESRLVRRRIHLAVAVGIVLAAVWLRPWFATTHLGAHLRQWDYETLVDASASPAPLPVTVVDVSQLPHELAFDVASQDNEVVTDRDSLRKVIEAVAERSPAAIGVDIDLGRFPDSGAAKGDAALLETCLRINRQIPIFLGVRRSLPYFRERNELLFDPAQPRADYGAIPVHAAHPIADPQEVQTGYGALNVSFHNPLATSAPGRLQLASLAAGLGEAYGGPRKAPPVLAADLQPPPNDLLNVQPFLLDPTPASRLAQGENVIHVKELNDLVTGRDLLPHHMVLIGSTRVDDGDTWWPPGENQVQPGVFWQACAATSWSARPLYEMDSAKAALLEVVGGLLILLPPAFFERKGIARAKYAPSPKWAWTLGALVAWSALAFFLALEPRVLWLSLGSYGVCLGLFALCKKSLVNLGFRTYTNWQKP